MVKPLEICMHRWEFVQRFSKGCVLDVGCKEGDTWSIPIYSGAVTNPYHISDIILCDIDVWEIRSVINSRDRFIRCFAENVPLIDKSVDTVVLAEIIEHVKYPNKLLTEAKRLTRDRIVITTGNEWKWSKDTYRDFIPPNGMQTQQDIKEYLVSRGKEYHKKYQLFHAFEHPTHECEMVVDDSDFSHCEHERDYDNEKFIKFIEDNSNGMNYQIFNLIFGQSNLVHLAAIMWWRNK